MEHMRIPAVQDDPTSIRDRIRAEQGWKDVDIIVHPKTGMWTIFSIPDGQSSIVNSYLEEYETELSNEDILHNAISDSKNLSELKDALLGTHTGVPCSPIVRMEEYEQEFEEE